tara:strand:- start:4 stop:198 length:195 start_codon:yes stop_codon:yes gene_type:complete
MVELNAYSYGKEGIHKTEMMKRIDNLEGDVDALKTILYDLVTLMENWTNQDEDTESLRPTDTTD